MKASANREMINLTDYASLRARRPLLVAHRGGVIASNAPENSLAAIRLAAIHGYDMVELDVQEAKDKESILFHDRMGNLLINCGINELIQNLTSDEITAIRYRASDQHVPTLAQALVLCKLLNLGVMLDIKVPMESSLSEAFFQRIGELLDEHQLTGATVTISNHPLAREYLADKVLFTVSAEDLQRVSCGESIPLHGQYWFGLPEELPSAIVKSLQRNGAFVIPAVNTFRYPAHAHYELARRDVERLLAAGVDGFQIDSVYEGFFEHLNTA